MPEANFNYADKEKAPRCHARLDHSNKGIYKAKNTLATELQSNGASKEPVE
jgi:hypothetical protein